MSLTTPTTQEISDNIVAQMAAQLGQSIPLLPKSFIRVLAKVMAGVFVILYKYGGFVALQQFVRTASANPTEFNGVTVVPLVEWGRQIGVGDPIAATRAELLIDITVTNQTGTLPSGSQLVNAANGVTYITIGAVALNAATVQATIRAVADQAGGDGSGEQGNLAPGAIVSFANPLANVNRNATVVSQSVTGADAESTEAYRQRVLDRFQQRPQGGAYADYRAWSTEVAGIANAYPYTSNLPGQVDVYIESATQPDGIPTGAQLDAVADSIEFDQSGLASRRPANAFVNVLPITRSSFEVLVEGLIVTNQAAVEAQITAAVQEYFLQREPFIDGLSVLPRLDRITRSAVGGVVDDIVNANGGVFVDVVVSKASIAFDLYALNQGEKAKASSVSFT